MSILLADRLARVAHSVRALEPVTAAGQVRQVSAASIELAGLAGLVRLGDRIRLEAPGHPPVPAEIVAYRNGNWQASAFGDLAGHGPASRPLVRFGAGAEERHRGPALAVSDAWLGRVLDPLGRPLDRGPPLPSAGTQRPVRAAPPDAASRARHGPPHDGGVRALNQFATSRPRQRLGLFAGSGVGKSTLLAMLARQARCDVAVLALIGERGREVREFIEDDLGPEGLARSVVVVATSDSPALMRREAAYAAMAAAEHFRDQGKSVLLLMDSVTRFCLACRDIALAAGELPATRGFPPSTFAELPRLLERAGPGPDAEPGETPAGQITAFFTVLVEGDDHDEPVADTVRGILDGHVVLSRSIAERGRYPAVDVLRSLSRTVPGCLTPAQAEAARRARALLAVQADMADMVRLGAYKRGTDAGVDEALERFPAIEALLRQGRDEAAGLTDGFAALEAALDAR